MRNLIVKKRDKRGMWGIIFFFIILFVILLLGFIASIVLGIIDFGSEQVTPIFHDLGVVGDTNLTQVSDYTFGVGDTLINSATWLIAFAFVMALVFSIVMVVGYNYNPNPAFIGIYIALMLFLIIVSIVISNSYEDILNGNDEISQKLNDQTTMSYLILYSPFILALITIIAGIFLFVGRGGNEGVSV